MEEREEKAYFVINRTNRFDFFFHKCPISSKAVRHSYRTKNIWISLSISELGNGRIFGPTWAACRVSAGHCGPCCPWQGGGGAAQLFGNLGAGPFGGRHSFFSTGRYRGRHRLRRGQGLIKKPAETRSAWIKFSVLRKFLENNVLFSVFSMRIIFFTFFLFLQIQPRSGRCFSVETTFKIF